MDEDKIIAAILAAARGVVKETKYASSFVESYREILAELQKPPAPTEAKQKAGIAIDFGDD